MAKDLEYYLAQARRIAEHREEGAEEAIRKEFKKLLKSLKSYIAEVHEKYAAGDGTLSFADLQKAGYDARFLEEIEKRIAVASPKVSKELHQLVEDTYELSYKSMVEGVDKVLAGAGLDETFADALAITPEQIRKVVKNPIMEVALQKNHRDIVYDIKQAVAVGLMNGDRYATIAQKITVALDKENGPYKNAMRIARTEAHRVREAGNNDAAVAVDKELQNGTTGLRMCKTWKTMKDERVRPQRRRKGKKGWSTKMGKGPNHMIMDGQTVLSEEDFDLQDGYKAPAPGSSGIAGHDIHCRCYASFEMLTDAEFYAKTGRHFPSQNISATGSPPVTIAGVNVNITNGSYGFSNGTENGIKKTVDAVTYTTPDGVNFVFPKRYNKKQQTMTPEQAIECWQKVPQNIRQQAQKTIEFVDYYNPMDTFWRKQYKNFGHSYATGGSKIAFYRYDQPHNLDYVVRTYCHEAGHYIDINRGSQGVRFSSLRDWTNAMASDTMVAGKKSPTTYGENSNTEDFAESIAEYVKDRTAFEKLFPNRARILKGIV